MGIFLGFLAYFLSQRLTIAICSYSLLTLHLLMILFVLNYAV